MAISFGARGPAVVSLQRRLNERGRPSPGLMTDGIFGQGTLAAVRAFQTMAGLVADGIVGRLTERALGLVDEHGARTGGVVRMSIEEPRSPHLAPTPCIRTRLEAFDIDSEDLRAEHHAVITERLVPLIRMHQGRLVFIEGHTSRTGTEAHNLALSLRRARRVREALAAEGIEEWRFHVGGFGETRSVSPLPEDAHERAVVVSICDRRTVPPRPQPPEVKAPPELKPPEPNQQKPKPPTRTPPPGRPPVGIEDIPFILPRFDRLPQRLTVGRVRMNYVTFQREFEVGPQGGVSNSSGITVSDVRLIIVYEGELDADAKLVRTEKSTVSRGPIIQGLHPLYITTMFHFMEVTLYVETLIYDPPFGHEIPVPAIPDSYEAIFAMHTAPVRDMELP